MKALLLATAMIVIFPLSSEAHSIKRNCLFNGKFNTQVLSMCRDGNNQPRTVTNRSIPTTPPDKPNKPDCKKDNQNKDYKKD